MATSNKRVIIGNEDDDAKVSVTSRGLKGALAVELLDSSGNQVSTFGGEAHSSVGNGSKTVTTAGVAVQLSSTSVPCKRVWIQAMLTNTGVISVGDSTVTTDGRRFYPTQGDFFNVSNLNLIYINSDTSNEGITYYYEN